MPKSSSNFLVLLVLLIIGGLAGSIAGDLLAPVLPWFKSTDSIGLRPATLDLKFISITFGFTAVINPMTVLGLIIGYFVYRRV